MLWFMLASVYFVLLQGTISVIGQCMISSDTDSDLESEENLQRIIEEHDHSMRSAFDKKMQTMQDQLSSRLQLLINETLSSAIDQINEKLNAILDRVNENLPNVVLPLLFDGSLETIYEQRRAVGVTKLRNEFYCLSEDGEIKVFADRYPFVLLRKFQLKEIKEAQDIVSCEKENALYILGIHRFIDWNAHVCVWKIEQNSKTNQSVVKWLELPDDFQPLTLYMSKRDQLLMVSRYPSPSLRIYGPDAQLRLLISLYPSIQWPIHAVETSTGNFVILHFLEDEEKKETMIEKRMKHFRVETAITTLSGDGKTIVHNYQPENEEQRLRSFDVSNLCFEQRLNDYGYLSIDSNDRVSVADYNKCRVILLDSNLRWNQILFPKSEGKDEDMTEKSPLSPRRLYYDEGKKQLVVCGIYGVEIVFLNKF